MKSKFTRRQAVTGIGIGVIASLVPDWIYAKDIKSLPNKIVTYLNPETILANRGVSKQIEKDEFNSSESWKLPFRIWTAIGGGQSENNGSSTIGYMVIQKTGNKEKPEEFTLEIRQKILQQGSRPAFRDDFHYTEAHIICIDNDIATPLAWEVKQSVWRANKKLEYCSFCEKGELETSPEGIKVRIRINDISRPEMQLDPNAKLTSDMTLIAALPKMINRQGSKAAKNFTLLEKMRLRKENHLLFRNPGDDYVSDNFGALHKIEHRGDGILPFDYWLDNNGCPLFLCTLHNAFIYDLQAEEKVEEICKTGKRRQFED
jgi:hypothetical protein